MTSLAGIDAVSWVELMNVVVRSDPLNRTTDVETIYRWHDDSLSFGSCRRTYASNDTANSSAVRLVTDE